MAAMADGSPIIEALLRYLAFALLAIVGPGLALQRALRLKIDPALVAPLGIVACAAAYALGLALSLRAVFPAALVLLNLGLLGRRDCWRLAGGPRVRGALAPLAVTIALFALTQYPWNRMIGDGGFAFDSGEGPDTAFYVGVAWELAVSYPPQAPALAGVPMAYHNGPHIVRGATAYWAGIHPYDAISRFDNTLLALALILALRGAVAMLGGSPRAVALISWAPLATDFSFIFAGVPGARWWSFLHGSSLLHSLFFARSTIFALTIALGILIAHHRHRSGEGRSWLVLAAGLAAALPFFNIFLCSLMLAGLALAFVVTRERRTLAVLAAPMFVVALVLLLTSRTADSQIYLDPLGAVQNTRRLLALAPLAGPALAAAGVLWLVAALGLRLVGLPLAIRSLRAQAPAACVLAVMALGGWPLRLLVHINADGRFDESAYFAEHSGACLWLFTAMAIAGLLDRLGRCAQIAAVLAVAALTLPSSAEFVIRKRGLTPISVSPAAVRAMRALERASPPGAVVLVRPSPHAPPLPMVLAGRRVYFNEYIRCLLQFAPHSELERRRQLQRSFFRARDPRTALAAAKEMGATFLYLPAGESIAFDPRGALETVYDEGGERVYRLLSP
jgi:hypothetical protein